jgi:hypothetical protein
MVPPSPGDRIARKPAPQEPRPASDDRASDQLPVRYATEPGTVMRVETESSEPSTSNPEQGSGDVDIDKLARDVYSTLRSRLRIEKERRG